MKIVSDRVCFGVLNIKSELCQKYNFKYDMFDHITRHSKYDSGSIFKGQGFNQRLKDFIKHALKAAMKIERKGYG